MLYCRSGVPVGTTTAPLTDVYIETDIFGPGCTTIDRACVHRSMMLQTVNACVGLCLVSHLCSHRQLGSFGATGNEPFQDC